QALLEYSRRELLSLSVRSGFSAADKCELFKQTSDINALIMLYRMTALGIGSPEDRAACFGKTMTLLSEKQKRALSSCADTKEFLTALSGTRYSNLCAGTGERSFEHVLKTALYGIMRKRLHFATDPTEALFAYMFLSENEIKNVVRICEGVRYGLPAQRIEEFLILGSER
nr:V-type ATPase subunit [Clostridia bacterium]